MATALKWMGEDVRLADVDRALAELRTTVAREHESMRTSVMSHIAWVPEEWLNPARAALEGMAERHPSRTMLLVPQPDAGVNRIDATVELESYEVPGSDRRIVTEVIELQLLGTRAKAPASIVLPLLISDLPTFLRWRGPLPYGSPELEQLLGVIDRLIVDSNEWDELPHEYVHLTQLFPRVAVSDIAWARTERWRRLLASLWPEVVDVGTVRVTGTLPQALLICGWLRSRLGRDEIRWEHVPSERLIG
ncbi:MAG: glucose-6-phosphate dehydrogenase assembly protein OpcA, partial [Actinomycetota bacterium]